MIKEHDAAIDFTLPDSEGRAIRVSDFKGKYVVLYFYPKDDTPGCTLEAVDFTRMLDAFTKINAVVIGISRDSVESHKEFCGKHSLKITLLSDNDSAVCTAYGVIKEKNMYGKKVMGIERSTFLIGPDGAIARIWRGVKADGHAKEVLEAIP
jgi:peroxiredoxin Q/BCP